MKLLRNHEKKPAGRRRLKLKCEFVPMPLWGFNLRADQGLGKGRWDTLRRKLKESGQTSCVICGSADRLHSHEVWEYHDRSKPEPSIAKLLRVEMVCRKCHDVKHWGSTLKLIAEGKITRAGYLGLRKHFRTVNKCSQKDFDRHLRSSLRLHQKRSANEWRIDWGDFRPALAVAKAAREAWAAQNPDHASQDAYNVGPGHHIPNRCPQCGATGTLKPIKADTEEMTEGQEADYEAGTWGFAFCRGCNQNVFWN